MTSFQKFGDWDIIMDLCKNMPAEIKASNKETLMILAGRAEAAAKKHINAQDLKWTPLDPDYLAKKVQAGHDERIYILKGSYLKSITHFLSDSGVKAYAGIPKKAKNENGQLIHEYAAVMEFGSVVRNIPPRPLWAPVMQEVYQFAKDNKIFSKMVLKAFRKRTGK